jgi:hypothetical protein
MKQMILLLVAVYSLIINQSNKKSDNGKKMPPVVRIKNNKSSPAPARLSPYLLIEPAFPFGNVLYNTGSYNPVYAKSIETFNP